MGNQMTFKRYEVKFMLTRSQRDIIQKAMLPYMNPDPHGKNTIQSLYFDTPDFLLARRSIEKPLYKEKLRLRSYGVANENSKVFLELKKKYKHIVYKRREDLRDCELQNYLRTRQLPKDSQIFRELDYTFERYAGLSPAVLLTYDREAFYAKNDHEFRITFDENILWRDYDLDLKKGVYGTPVLDSDKVLMEIKVAAGIPLWLVSLLSDLEVYKTSFSKYGTAYKQLLFDSQKDSVPEANIILGGNKKYA